MSDTRRSSDVPVRAAPSRRLPLSPLALALCAAGAISALPAQAQTTDKSAPAARFSPKPQLAMAMTDRIIVKYRDASNPSVVSSKAGVALRVAANRQGVGTQVLRKMADGSHVIRLNRRISIDDAQAMAVNLRAGDASIEYAEPDLLLQTAQSAWTPSDPLYSQQWSLTDATGGIRAPGAWSRTRGAGVTVAVIDTGVRPHADLTGNLVPGIDFITDPAVAVDGNGRDSDASDPGDHAAAGACGSGSRATNSSWHGTHVAGIVGAVSNSAGVTGIAPAAKLLPLRALGRCGGYMSDIADAVVWASGGSITGIAANPNPARVINLSLGGTGSCSLTLQNAINGARSRGSVVVVAAGNSDTNAANATPANCSGVITVAATARSGGKASYSNYGSVVSLAAPGGDSGAGILSTLNAGTTTPGADNYASYMGTSMAAPVVAGVAALVLSAKPSLSPDQVATILKGSARPFPAACSGCGSGIVNADAAVTAALSATAPAPAPTPAPPPPPPPAPAPAPSSVSEREPNNTLAQAQVLSASVLSATGTLTGRDQDHFRVTLGAGKRLSATVRPTGTAAPGIGVFLTNGRQLLLMGGANGASRQALVTNSGSTPVDVVIRVYHLSGNTGAYTLSLAQ
jgi:serine protease